AAFLQAYFDGDGTVDARTGAYAVSKSPRLASQVQMLLSRLGIVAFRRTTCSRATNGRMTQTLPYEQIGIYADDVITLAGHIRFRCAHKQRNLERLVARRRVGKSQSNRDKIQVALALFHILRVGQGPHK